MASLSERLALIIDFNGAQAVKGLEGLAKQSEKAEDKWDKASKSLTRIGAAGLAASGVAATGLSKLAMGASDLNEVTSKTKVIFGDAADQVIDFGKNAAKSLGQSERAALEAATGVAQLGKAAGLSGGDLAKFSTDLVGLAGDLASFNNTSPEEAIQALGAALRGESEPIRAYGVLLDDATLKQRALSMGLIETTTGTLPPAIKVQAAYAEILAQTKDAQGDFARTSEGAANQQRILKAEIENLANGIGTGLLPAFTGIVSGAASVVGAFNGMGGGAKETFGLLAAGGTATVAAVSGMSLIAGQAIKLKDRFTEVNDGIRSLTTAGKFAAGAAVGVGVLTVALVAMQERAAAARKRVDDLEGSMKELGVTAEQAAGRKLLELVVTSDKFDKAMTAAALSQEDLSRAVGGSQADFDKARGALEAYIRRMEGSGKATEAGVVQARQLIVALEQQRTAVDGVNERERQAAEVKAREAEAAAKQTEKADALALARFKLEEHTVTVTEAEDDYAATLKLTNDLADDAARYQKELADSIDGVWEATQKALNPTFAYHQSLRDVADGADEVSQKAKDAAEATKKHGAESKEAAKANRELQGAQEQLAQDIQEASLRLLEMNGTVAGSKEAYDTQIRAIQDLRATYGSELGPIGAMIDDLELKLRRAAQQAANLAANARIAAGGGAGYNAPGASSVGGPVMETAAFARSSAPVTINVTSLDPQAAGRLVVDAIASYERTNGTGWRS